MGQHVIWHIHVTCCMWYGTYLVSTLPDGRHAPPPLPPPPQVTELEGLMAGMRAREYKVELHSGTSAVQLATMQERNKLMGEQVRGQAGACGG